MNKKILIIFMFILGFMFMPIVNAEELPREGVTYFMQYPDGSEDVTESYDKAVTYPEKVVFQGTTDSNGQVTIEGLGNQGEVRVVEEVPDGYTAKTKEIKLDLSNKQNVEITNKARFTNAVKNVVRNPKTGMSILLFIFVIGLTIYTIKTKKNKKLLVIIPVMLGILLVSNVQASESSFKVTVKDDNGNAQSGVTVKVYAKPVNIDAAPAMKFDANGGYFADGETLIYAKIPYNGCDHSEVWNYWYSISEDYGHYMDFIFTFPVVREGYYQVFSLESIGTVSNGTTISTEWQQDSNATIATLHANGGVANINGKVIEEVKIYQNAILPPTFFVGQYFKNGSMSIVGYDETAACTNIRVPLSQVEEPHLIESAYATPFFKNHDRSVAEDLPSETSMPDNVYICWGEREDIVSAK